MTPEQMTQMIQEVHFASMVTEVAQAYAHAKYTTSGYDEDYIAENMSDRQWQASCAVATRFLSNPDAMTPELCHHEWRLVMMRSSPPAHWPPSARQHWPELGQTDRLVESMGLRAMRDCLTQMQQAEEEALTEHLHPDAQRQHEIENGWAEE